jgi:hypothetical protein
MADQSIREQLRQEALSIDTTPASTAPPHDAWIRDTRSVSLEFSAPA